jgi:hypothetical protein
VLLPARWLSRAIAGAVLAGALAALALAMPRADAATAARGSCPTFRVLHNDRIGRAILPAGTYNVRLVRGSKLTCAKASALFTRFLEDYDGVLPHRWRVVPKGRGKARFLRPGNRGFAVARTGRDGHHHSRLGHLCPGKFHVLHGDRIGPLFFRAGYYQIYIPRRSIIPCKRASAKFAAFLDIPSGRLPNGWKIRRERAVFFRRANPRLKRFRVDPGT